MVRKAIIVTPTSLVSNWEAEIKKWVGERVRLVALCESTREDVVSGIGNFTSPRSNLQVKFPTIRLFLGQLQELHVYGIKNSDLQVLIVSYETFRMHSSKFSSSGSCDLLICDEAHRLKNDQTITNRVLQKFFTPLFYGHISELDSPPYYCGSEFLTNTCWIRHWLLSHANVEFCCQELLCK